MKSEQEFLTAMWSEIETQESEARQKLMTHELNKRLFIREVFAYGIIIALLAAGSLIAFLVKDNPEIIYAVAALLFSAAFLTERAFYSKLQGVVVDEN